MYSTVLLLYYILLLSLGSPYTRLHFWLPAPPHSVVWRQATKCTVCTYILWRIIHVVFSQPTIGTRYLLILVSLPKGKAGTRTRALRNWNTYVIEREGGETEYASAHAHIAKWGSRIHVDVSRVGSYHSVLYLCVAEPETRDHRELRDYTLQEWKTPDEEKLKNK